MVNRLATKIDEAPPKMTDQRFLDFLNERRISVLFQYAIYVKVRNRLCINSVGFLALTVVFFYAFTLNTTVYHLWNVLTFMCTGLTGYCCYQWVSFIRAVRIRVGPDMKLPPRQAFELVTAEYEMVKNADVQRR